MIDISLGGLIGAIAGTIVAALAYGTLASAAQRWLIARQSAQEARTSEQELALLRRGILAIELFVFGGLGYWIGQEIGG